MVEDRSETTAKKAPFLPRPHARQIVSGPAILHVAAAQLLFIRSGVGVANVRVLIGHGSVEHIRKVIALGIRLGYNLRVYVLAIRLL